MANDINVNFTMPKGGDIGSGLDNMYEGMGSGGFLSSLLERLTNSINKLNENITRANSLNERSQVGSAASNSNSAGSAMATSLGAAIGITAARMFGIETQAIMARATNAGGFISSAIGGQANQAFGGYASRYYDIERQRQIANNSAFAEGAGGLIGGFVGSALGLAGAAGLGGIGAGIGSLAAAGTNADIQKNYMAQAAMVKLLANASVSEWQSGFSRWGLPMTNTTLVNSSLTGGSGISAPLQQDFIQGILSKPGGITNLKDIQEKIVPYMTQNPMNSNLDLNRLAQQFKQAGFSANEFSKLTLQSAQYMAVSGKTMNQFGDDIKAARDKFGYGYSASTNQLALNLMSEGIAHDRAQSLAYQSQFNPGLMSGIQVLSGSGYGDFIRRQTYGNMLGFNMNKWLSGSTQLPESLRKKYLGEVENALAGNSYGMDVQYLKSGSGLGLMEIAAKLRPLVDTNSRKSSADPTLGPGQEAATMNDLLGRVDNMNVTAGVVNIINSGTGSDDIAMQNLAHNASHIGKALWASGVSAYKNAESLATYHSPAKMR